ncbi:mas-related G-protein coupled receptor member H [Anolis carolinensis]|uniref:mas-related G-protein coupled receptor member H n=1 Tax=Anolis carolinensis TaxID=28377 RepID=UPI002F2B42A1
MWKTFGLCMKMDTVGIFFLYTEFSCNYIDFNIGNISIHHLAINGSSNNISNNLLIVKMINIVIILICLLGLLGNGRVIWLLGFNNKRNPFTTYIMNLSIADFGVLTCLLGIASFVIALHWYGGSYAICLCFHIVLELLFFTYSSSQFLLTIISIDRCVAVLFPIWHRCHRPPYLSTVVCAIVWILSSLLSGIHFTFFVLKKYASTLFFYQITPNILLCAPLMIISTLTLFLKVCCKRKQHQRGKLVTAILLTLLFFLLFCFPLNVSYVIRLSFYGDDLAFLLRWIGFACASLNSSINPLIYFLVGRRQKKGRAKVSMKVALERVFKDEQDTVEEETPMEESHV